MVLIADEGKPLSNIIQELFKQSIIHSDSGGLSGGRQVDNLGEGRVYFRKKYFNLKFV